MAEAETVECPHCHESVKANTTYCPLCFRSLTLRDHEIPLKTDWKTISIASLVIGCVTVFSIWMWGTSWQKMALGTYHPFQASAEQQAERAAKEAADKEWERYWMANSMAEDFVKDKLKSPSTAKFADFDKASVKDMGNNTFMVKSSVDSQNSFGAMMHMDFVAIVHDNGDKTWKIKDFALKQRD